jgi:hypothetical protein
MKANPATLHHWMLDSNFFPVASFPTMPPVRISLQHLSLAFEKKAISTPTSRLLSNWLSPRVIHAIVPYIPCTFDRKLVLKLYPLLSRSKSYISFLVWVQPTRSPIDINRVFSPLILRESLNILHQTEKLREIVFVVFQFSLMLCSYITDVVPFFMREIRNLF